MTVLFWTVHFLISFKAFSLPFTPGSQPPRGSEHVTLNTNTVIVSRNRVTKLMNSNSQSVELKCKTLHVLNLSSFYILILFSKSLPGVRHYKLFHTDYFKHRGNFSYLLRSW